jgi:hypothetical protein
MSGPFGSSQWMYSSGGFYPTEIEQSLRFNDDDSAYLSWTPASAGNRKTWTWSGWVKRGNIDGTYDTIIRGGDAGSQTGLYIYPSEILRLDLSGAYAETSAVFRDPSAWYHIIVGFNSTEAAQSDRVKLWVNGVNLQTTCTVTLNQDGFLNTSGYLNTIGYNAFGTANFDGYLAEVNFIDGQALDPTDFGEFKSGVWVAKSYAGSYGTNGFYLPFNDPNFIGKDYSTVLGSELITNGTFDTDLTGWSDYHGESNIAQENGRLKIFRDTRTFPKAVQDISTTIGADYVATLTYVGGTHDGDIGLEIVDSVGSIGDLTLTPTDGTQYQVKFTATETTTTIRVAVDSITNVGEYSLFDDVSIREIITQGNDWTANNLGPTDVVLDSPTNNFATLNPLAINGTGVTLSEGNLKYSNAPANTGIAHSTFDFKSGKWYCEVVPAGGTSPTSGWLGVRNRTTGDFAIYFGGSGDKWTRLSGSLTSSAYGATYTTGDVIGIAYDADTGDIEFFKNGVSQGTFDTTLGGQELSFYFSDGSSGDTYLANVNFGQDSSFAGNKTAQGNTDDNGVSDFYYAPPSGYLALCTANLPDPVIDPAQDDVPSDYFNTVLYTGNGSTQSITGVNFQPDFVWLKARSQAYTNSLNYKIGSAIKRLSSNETVAELESSTWISSFDSDGFTLGNDGGTNGSGVSFVAWNWLAGNGTSSNTDGSITSTVSVNQKAGFSVVSYTGTGSAATVGHGLGAAPSMIIAKGRDFVDDWIIYHSSLGASYGIKFTTGATENLTGWWNGVSPTSSVFSVGNFDESNKSGNDFIAYCFAEVEGYSKFGSYTGNGSTDGPFVHCGFRPAWVMLKKTNNTGAWVLIDNKRGEINAVDEILQAHVSNAELTGTDRLDIVSNGFKLRTDGGAYNASGDTYIFMAFAEMPAKYSLGR